MFFKTHFNKYFSSFGLFFSSILQKHTVTVRTGNNTGLKVSTDTADATGNIEPKIPLHISKCFTQLCPHHYCRYKQLFQ